MGEYYRKIKMGMACIALLVLSFIAGCKTASIPVSLPMPGEYNLSGVSKIALVDFNSISDSSGILQVDSETLKIVQNMVSSAFSESKIYGISRLDVERVLAEQAAVHPDKRFDAVLYGQVWWEITPENYSPYPVVYSLESWDNVKYTKKTLLGKTEAVAKVTRQRKQELATHVSRSWNASLMLTLTLYRLNSNGEVMKLVDTFAVGNQFFSLNNGELTKDFSKVGADDAGRASGLKKASEKTSLLGELKGIAVNERKRQDFSGKVQLIQKTITLPTELQAKIMLTDQLASSLVKKVAPSSVVINIECAFDDEKLFNLLKDGAYDSAKEYISYALQQKYGREMCRRFAPLVNYPVTNVYLTKVSKLEISNKDFMDAMKESGEYLFALGLCEEACGEYEEALETYRFAFKYISERQLALGISRCLFALDMNKRVKEKTRAFKDSVKKSGLK